MLLIIRRETFQNTEDVVRRVSGLVDSVDSASLVDYVEQYFSFRLKEIDATCVLYFVSERDSISTIFEAFVQDIRCVFRIFLGWFHSQNFPFVITNLASFSYFPIKFS